MTTLHPSLLLRRALLADGLVGVLTAVHLLLLSGWVAPNLFGYALVIGQASVVLVFIKLEWLGLKRSPVASPSFARASTS